MDNHVIVCMHADLERAQAAITSLGTNPKSVSMTYLSRLATDRDQWGPGRPLDGSLYNYTLSFAQAPSVTTSWRCDPWVASIRTPLEANCACQQAGSSLLALNTPDTSFYIVLEFVLPVSLYQGCQILFLLLITEVFSCTVLHRKLSILQEI